MFSLYISLFEFILLLLLMWFLLSKQGRQVFRWLKKSVKQEIEKVKARRQRTWHPKSEWDCPHCQSGVKLKVIRGISEAVPWSECQGISLLTRKTWSLAQSEEQLRLHVEWWRAYYHFVRPHETLGEPLPGV